MYLMRRAFASLKLNKYKKVGNLKDVNNIVKLVYS